ncbi:MAG: protein kinase [Gemmatimonadota bacterium]
MADDFDRIHAALSEVYVIEREIGRGGMATVYLAEDLKHGRRVAIKVLHPDIAASLGRERFLREIEIVANLRHSGILPLYDSGEADGLLYYVMPYVEGPTLRDRLDKEKQLAVDEALRITSELAAALDEAHSYGVIHRDIKPENVLFEGDQPLIADFGVATALEEAGGEKLTRTGVAVGTPSYMSPEQAAGGETDSRSDEYALACVLYEMLGGTPPFTGPTPQAVMARHALDPVPDLGTVRPTAPEGVVAAVERAMAKVPADRYRSAGAFAEALEKGDERRRRSSVRRRRWEWAVGALIVLAGGAAYMVADRSDRAGNEEPRRIAVLPFEITGAELPDTGLALGLFAEVTEGLRESGLSALPVEAVRDYRITHGVVEEVAADLDLDIVWLTRLRAWGDHAHVRVDLVDARSQASLEATLIVVPMSDLSEVAPRLVTWASRVLAPSDSATPYEPHPEARRAFDRARRAWEAGEVLMADSLLGEVQDIDPEYPRAKGMNALLTVQFVHPHPGGPPSCEKAPALIPLAKQSAEEALALDPTLALPHVALGHALWEHEFDWTGGEAELLAALQLDPDQPDANYFYGAYLMTAGRMDEAWEYYSGTVESNLSARRYQYFLNRLADLTGHLADAEQTLRRAAILFSTEVWGSDDLIANLREQGRIDEAIELLLETGADTVANPLDDNVRWAIARGSDEAVDRHIAQRVERGSFHSAAKIALLAGRYDLAMQYLRRWWPSELACPSLGRVWLLADFPGLADRPQFQEMMDVAGIPWRESTVWAEMSN